MATVDGWLNGNRREAFYNGEPRRRDVGVAAATALPPRESIAPRLLAGLMAVSAIVMLTFVAAAAIVHNFSNKTVTRLTYAKVEVSAEEFDLCGAMGTTIQPAARRGRETRLPF